MIGGALPVGIMPVSATSGRAGKVALLLHGWKKCTPCEVFIKWDGKNCPCCHTKLGLKPKSGKARHRYHEMAQTKEL